VSDTRVTLDTVVHAFEQGHTAEEIVSHYPALRLADVYTIIAYYLNNQAEVEAYLRQQQEKAVFWHGLRLQRSEFMLFPRPEQLTPKKRLRPWPGIALYFTRRLYFTQGSQDSTTITGRTQRFEYIGSLAEGCLCL
jgi:hypothetical protein